MRGRVIGPVRKREQMSQPQTITSLPELPSVERRRRAVQYTIAMGLRVACIVSLFFVQGWWMLVPAVLAIVLPYFAVVVANVATRSTATTVERPGAIVRVGSDGPGR